MLKQLFRLAGVSFVLVLFACSGPEPETASEPQPPDEPAAESSRAPDPTVVDPDHYTVEFENDAVRIVRINYGPGEESIMHYHPDSVAVYLDDIEAEMTLPDGSTIDAGGVSGAAMFSPAGAHLPRNTSDSAFEVVEVELKPRDSGRSDPGGPDPAVVDADHYTAEFENDDVRVLRISYGPGEESVMHYHPDSVAVFVTDHLVEMTLPDGSTEVLETAAGDVLYVPGGQHLPRNIADSGWELVLIELK